MAKKVKRAKKGTQPSVKAILVRVNDAGWRALQILAIEQDSSVQALGVEAFNDLLRKNGRPASVSNPFTGATAAKGE